MAHTGSEAAQGCCRCMVPFPAVGNFHVEFMPIDWDGIDGGCAILAHYDVPHQVDVATNRPYDGPLCEHELAYLRGIPGRDFNWGWRFTVTPITAAAPPVDDAPSEPVAHEGVPVSSDAAPEVPPVA